MSNLPEMMCPGWVVLHVPHDSTLVPDEVRNQIALTDDELAGELVRMTDHLTLSMFASGVPISQVVCAPVSRLVVDVERFADDQHEPMARRGMGAIYSVTSDLKPLRRPLSAKEREGLMQTYYLPHHARLEAAVSAAIERYDRCLVIDCHSFPAKALPYEMADPGATRPDICIGTDDFHTGPALASAFRAAFQDSGLTVRSNDPFAGALVPSSRYRRDSRVSAVMVEINRRLYLQESEAAPLAEFADVARRVRACCSVAIAACY